MNKKLFCKVLSGAAFAAAAMLAVPSSKAFAIVTTEVKQTKMVVTAEIAEPSYKEYGDTVFLYRIFGTGSENKGQEKYCVVTIPAGETTGSTVVTGLDHLQINYNKSEDSADDIKAAQEAAKGKYTWSIARIPASTRYSMVSQSSSSVVTSSTVYIAPEKKEVSTKANPYEQNGVYIYASDGDGKAIEGKRFRIKNSSGQYVTATKQDDGTYLYSGLSATPQTYETNSAGRVTIYKDTTSHVMPADTYTIYAVDATGNTIAKTEASRAATTTASMISYSAVFDSVSSEYKVTTDAYMMANYKYMTRDYERTSHSVLKVNHVGGTTRTANNNSVLTGQAYTVTFNAGNGTFADGASSKTVTYNRNKTTGEWSVKSGSKSYEEPTYDLHTFSGWSASNDAASVGLGTTEADIETYLENNAGSDDWSGTIYAQWSK